MRKQNRKNVPSEVFLETPEALGHFLREVRQEAGLVKKER